MNKEIKELIKQHLPEATGGALKERLEELEEKEQYLETSKKQCERLLEQLNEKEKLVDELFEKLNKHQDLDKRTKELDAGWETLEKDMWKFEIEKKALEAQHQASHLIAAKLTEYTKILVGHPSVTIQNTREKYVSGGQHAERQWNPQSGVDIFVPVDNPDKLVTETDTTTKTQGRE